MRLTYEQIASIAQGVTKVEQTEEGIQFHRFTEEQERVYRDSRFHPRQYATAGVRLHFKTDSKTLYMKVLISMGCTRNFFAHDILVNGKMIGSLKNETEECCGEFEESFMLGDGEKDVCIHFPWSMCSILKEFCLDDNSFIEPVKKGKKMIIFGDSITQGADALNPSSCYAVNLADALDADAINKGIGGERYCPWLAALKDDMEPDYISVAYGTNHFRAYSPEESRRLCEEFWENLVANYPNAKIFALTPIWRKDNTGNTQFQRFEDIGESIADVVKKYDNVTCISGLGFVPEDETLFADAHLHPNNAGFKYYSERVCAEVLAILGNQ